MSRYTCAGQRRGRWRGCASGAKHVNTHRVANACHVGALGQIVAAASSPHEHVVRQVPSDGVGLVLRCREDQAKRGDVLVIPRVAVGDGGALADACNLQGGKAAWGQFERTSSGENPPPGIAHLVPVVPPCHDPSILWRMVAQPPVCLAVVIHHHLLPIIQLGLEHDLRLRQALGQLVGVVVKVERRRHGGVHEPQAERQPDGQREGVVVNLVRRRQGWGWVRRRQGWGWVGGGCSASRTASEKVVVVNL
eukprot:scaffold12605_cov114-Isochrysis_galbana.AAC.2